MTETHTSKVKKALDKNIKQIANVPEYCTAAPPFEFDTGFGTAFADVSTRILHKES